MKYLRFLILTIWLLLVMVGTAQADPISGSLLTSFLISLAVSAATTAATLALNYLFAPKPKPIDKNKLQGDIQLSNVGEDLPIMEVYGGRLADDIGGMKIGGVYIYCEPIRRVIVDVPGGGGGKGGPKAPPNREYHYYATLAVMLGRGPLKVLQIKAGTDVIYQDFPVTATGTSLEAEDAVLAGGAVMVVDNFCSGGKKVTGVGNGGTVTFANVAGDGTYPQTIYLCYKSSVDKEIVLTVNGAAQTLNLPNTYNNVENIAQTFYLQANNTIVLSNPTASADIDRLVVGLPIIEEEDPELGISGVRNPGYVNPSPTYSNFNLIDPTAADRRAFAEHNYQPKADAEGMIEATLTGGANVRIYEGNYTQLPDPHLQGHFTRAYGSAAATPAFRGRCYFMLTDFEITKYGTIPNFTAIVENREIKNLGKMYESRAKRVGLESSEIDFSALETVPLRGYAIPNRQSPRSEMEILNRVFEVDVVETDGKIFGVIPDEEITAEIPLNELDVENGKDGSNQTSVAPRKPVETTVVDEYSVPSFFDVSFFHPTNDFETANEHSLRSQTVSEKKENIETGLALTPVEGAKFAARELQRIWAEKDALSMTTFHKYAFLKPTDLIKVQELDGSWSKLRIKGIQGGVPGALTLTGVSRRIEEPLPRFWEGGTNPNSASPFYRPSIPAHAVGTVFEAVLQANQPPFGFYAGCALTNQKQVFAGASLYVEKDYGWQHLADFPTQAIIGRTVTGANGILGDGTVDTSQDANFDDAATVRFDLFYGDLNSLTDESIIDGANLVLIGNEILSFATAARINGFPNRWEISRLKRGLRGTSAVNHVVNERVLLLTRAVKFVKLDESERGKTRNYKFITPGQAVESASALSYTISDGQNRTKLNNTGASGAVAKILQPKVEGWQVFAEVTANHKLVLSGDGADVRFALDDGVSIESNDVGSSLILEFTGGKWLVRSAVGNWSVNV